MLTYFTQELVRVERVDVFGTFDNEKLFWKSANWLCLLNQRMATNESYLHEQRDNQHFSIKRLASTFCLNQSVSSIDTNQWIVCYMFLFEILTQTVFCHC